MIIGGIEKFSLIDFPGKTSAIIFTLGCNFRCRYCHNPELVQPDQFLPEMDLKEIYDFLESRRGKLDAVTITGGEPTQHKDLIEMIEKIKEMGFLVKLDSNGSRPEVLEEVINRKIVDYIAMDIKAPLSDYVKIVGWEVPVENLEKSIRLIIDSGIPHEFRTTIVKSLTSKDDLRQIAQTVKGAKSYFLQKFISTKLNDPSLVDEVTYTDQEFEELARELAAHVDHCGVR